MPTYTSGIKAPGRLSKDTIPDEIMHAKQIAVAELLIGAPFRSYAAIAASTRPEHNVVGIGVGQKVKNGHKTDELAVRVYVERKLAPGLIMDEFKLPTSVEGVSVDVVETGRFRALSTVVPIGQRWRRPARPGCSIGFQFTGSMAGYVMAGTFGAMVQSNGERYILSNNHVLANENSLPVGSAIFQPGLLDHGNPNTDAIARLTKFVSLKKNAPNSLDCAIAEILDGKKTALPTFLPRVGSLASGQVADAAEEMPVHKVGRTTGYTKGTVFDVSADVMVDYEVGRLKFNDQILIRGETKAFSAAGDSGSAIIARDSGRAVGLLFAGSDSHTIANPMSDVLATLGVDLVI